MNGVLSEFQTRTLLSVKCIFSEKGLIPPPFECHGEKKISLHAAINEKGVEIYIYDEGAEFFGERVDRRFESPDYKTLDDFLFHPEGYSEPKTIFRMIKEFFQGKSNK